MNSASVIESMGAVVWLVDGKVRVAGLDRLDRATAVRVLEVARASKAEIVEELKGRCAAPPSSTIQARRRHWMTPELVENFKASRPWLLEHLDALLTVGWTRDELFRVRRPLGHPYSWGVAWGNGWRTADAVTLQDDGWIAYHYLLRDGRVNVLHSWPSAKNSTEDRK